ncbi:MAG: amino acid permease, partial [Kiritimatiellae bacterium]|nr:amino acid permease [Kiritimatiellia bacterium]
MTVVSRLLYAMAADGVLPAGLGAKGTDGTPTGAVVFVAGVSLLIPFLGRTAIGFIVDVATIGAAIAYAYTSAAAFRRARTVGNRFGMAMGTCGLLLSGAICVLFILPNYFSGSMMATESYLILVLWCIFGFVFYRFLFGRDQEQRFGHSTVVWIALLVMIFFMSHMWMRQASVDATKRSFSEIRLFHDRNCAVGTRAGAPDSWRDNMTRQLDAVNSSLVHVGLVQAGLMAVSLVIMFSLYAMLRRRERRLEQENTLAKSYFFSTVSHDIRTPLNAIIGFSEMLKTGFKTDAEREQALDSILVSGRTLLGLINDVLDLSKLESGRMEISPEPTDCSRLLHVVMDAFRVSGDKPGMELRCEIGEMPMLMLDPQRLRQIVFNLVGNAVKFTEKGHVELKADYERTEGSEVGVFRLSVEDTGCGIREEDLKRICSAYVQVGAKLARNGGTGLGLAISRQLVKAMGGELKVKSELGQGSTFSITIPDVRSIGTNETEETKGTDGTNGTPEASAPPDVAQSPGTPPRSIRRILIVDDSKMNLMVLKAHLKRLGDYETVLAADGQEALAKLEAPGETPIDLVLTDMWMPNLDGEGLVKAIRANPALSSLRVLVVTADVEMREKAAEMKFDGILLKPVTTAVLEQALRRNGGSAI